jgi:molybdate transport system ATP-binding protein
MTIDIRLHHQVAEDFALDVSLTLPSRGVTAVFGRSGAGKSTLLAALSGLITPDIGYIAINGEPVVDSARTFNLAAHRRRIAVVFQDARLFPHLTVHGNLDYPRRHGPARPEPGRFDAVVDLLGLEPLLARRPRTLSGGEAQRVALGRALLASPRLLLLDEPLAALDGARKDEILPFLDRLTREGGVPILYVSHALDEVMRLAGHLVLMDRGHAVASGPIARVASHPMLAAIAGEAARGGMLHLVVAGPPDSDGLLPLRPQITRDREDPVLHLAIGDIPPAPGTAVRLRIAARDVALALDAAALDRAGVSIRNRLPCLVRSVVTEADGLVAVTLDLAGTGAGRRDDVLLARITPAAARDLGLQPGLPVLALIKSLALGPV